MVLPDAQALHMATELPMTTILTFSLRDLELQAHRDSSVSLDRLAGWAMEAGLCYT